MKKTKAGTRPKVTTNSASRSKFTTENNTQYEVDPSGALLGGGGATEAGWHSIEAFLRCPKEYQFKVLRKIHVPSNRTPAPFAIGGLFHAGRARWFASGFKTGDKIWLKIADDVRKASGSFDKPVHTADEQSALRHLMHYIQNWSKFPKPKVIAAEYKLGPVEIIKGDPSTVRTARLDDISYYPEMDGALCIGESKTTSTSVADTVKQYTLHGQPMVQALTWKLDPHGEKKHGKIAGIMLDVTVKSDSPTELPKFGRAFVPITDYQLEWFAESLAVYIRSAKGMDRNSYATRNVGSCTRLVGRGRMACEYADLCRYGPDAAARYVIGAKNEGLKTWAKAHPEDVAPWV